MHCQQRCSQVAHIGNAQWRTGILRSLQDWMTPQTSTRNLQVAVRTGLEQAIWAALGGWRGAQTGIWKDEIITLRTSGAYAWNWLGNRLTHFLLDVWRADLKLSWDKWNDLLAWSATCDLSWVTWIKVMVNKESRQSLSNLVPSLKGKGEYEYLCYQLPTSSKWSYRLV